MAVYTLYLNTCITVTSCVCVLTRATRQITHLVNEDDWISLYSSKSKSVKRQTTREMEKATFFPPLFIRPMAQMHDTNVQMYNWLTYSLDTQRKGRSTVHIHVCRRHRETHMRMCTQCMLFVNVPCVSVVRRNRSSSCLIYSCMLFFTPFTLLYSLSYVSSFSPNACWRLPSDVTRGMKEFRTKERK